MTRKKLIAKNDLGVRTVYGDDGNVIAVFTGGVNGQWAYAEFINAMAKLGNVSVFDNETHKFLVGTVAELET